MSRKGSLLIMLVGFAGLAGVGWLYLSKPEPNSSAITARAPAATVETIAPAPEVTAKSKALIAEAHQLLEVYSGDSTVLRQAKSKLDEALKLDPTDTGNYVEQASITMKSERLQLALPRAEALLRKGLRFHPDYGNAYVELGYILAEQGRMDEAQEAFKNARKFAATSPWLDFNEAQMLLLQEKKEEAAVRYAQIGAAEGAPARIRGLAYEAFARIKAKQGDAAAARQAYEKVFKLIPDDAWTMGNYSHLLRVSMLDVKESEKWGRRALDRMHYRFGEETLGKTLYLAWAEALIVEKNEAKAEKYFAEAQELLSSPAELLHEIGDYPHEHPIIDALAAKGYSLDQFEGSTGSTSVPTPMEMAVGSRNLAIAKQLVKAGARVDQPAYLGVTPLMIAAAGNDTPMLEFLLSKGADPSPLTAEGEDAEALARKHGYVQAAQLLADAKARLPASASSKVSRGALQIGHIYRVRVRIDPIEGFGDVFAAGEVLRYAGRGGDFMNDDRSLNTAFVSYAFLTTNGEEYTKGWAVAANKLTDGWTQYFEEVEAQEKK